MTARSNFQTAQISFEVHVQRDGRRLAEELFEDQDAALEYAERLRQRRDVDGIRVVREIYDPGRDEAFERVIFDTGVDLHKVAEPGDRRRRAAPERGLFARAMAPFSGIGRSWLWSRH